MNPEWFLRMIQHRTAFQGHAGFFCRCRDDTFRLPALSHFLLRSLLAFSHPGRVVLFSDLERRMAEQYRDCLDVHSSKEQLDSESVSEAVGMSTSFANCW